MRQLLAQQIIDELNPKAYHTAVEGWPVLVTPQMRAWADGEAVIPTSGYYNSETEKVYVPHHREEYNFITNNVSKYVLLKGGWRGGKTVAGLIKLFERLKGGCGCIMVSPDYQHFSRSLWMEFDRWCPWGFVDFHQKTKRFIKFKTGGWLLYGGIDDPASWEGPTANFILFDEARRKSEDAAMKILMSRASVMGPFNQPPQLVITTTPSHHWLHNYFGPLIENDPYADFKAHAKVYTLVTTDNLENLDPDYVRAMSSGLSEAEIAVNLNAEWVSLGDNEAFLPSMSLWDACAEELPPLNRREPMVLAVDAAVGRASGHADCFGLIGVTRHPFRHSDVAVRFIHKWQPKSGRKLDFQLPEKVIRDLCKDFSPVMVCYDPYQLHDMMSRMNMDNLSWFFEFPQGSRRAEADKQLFDLIISRRLAHDGNKELREHISNADKKLADDGRKIRIVKRHDSLKIDLAIALGMASFECLRLNL